jgi:uncharacterized coiled-coil protein SlyX
METSLNAQQKNESTRLEDFEIRLAFQDQSLAELRSELTELTLRYVRVCDELARLKQSIEQLRSGPDPIDEKPPHY